MSPPSRSGRLQDALAAAVLAADRNAALPGGSTELNEGPTPRDLYLFREDTASLEWGVILVHPHARDWFFLVPADDSPFVGTADISAPAEPGRQTLHLRCGQGLWLPAGQFDPTLRVGIVPEGVVRAARQTLAALARGTLTS